MGWNGNGVVVRQTPVASGTVAWADTKAAGDVTITTADHDYHDQNLADAITNTIAKDGQNSPTANLDMGGFRHTDAQDAVNIQDYATLNQLNGSSPITGDVRNASMQLPADSLLGTFTADQVTVSTTLGGRTWRLSNYSVAFNLGVTGAGGMDTGSAPTSGYVALYAIYNPTTSTASILGQDVTAAVAPTRYQGSAMPAGYTGSALISVWPTDTSHRLVAGIQVGRELTLPQLYGAVLSSSNTQHASATALSISGAVPKNAVSCRGFVTVASTISSALSVGLFAASYTAPSLTTATGSSFIFSFTDVLIGTPQQIYYTATAGSGTMTLSININGYTF